MHYVGMLAFRLPVPVQYDWPTVLLSLMAAVLSSAVALFIVSRPSMGLAPRRSTGSIFIGGGIAAMHYIGMEAMRLPAMCVLFFRCWWPYPCSWLIVISFVALMVDLCVADKTRPVEAGEKSSARSRWARPSRSCITSAWPLSALRRATQCTLDLGPRNQHLVDFGLAIITVITFMVLGLVFHNFDWWIGDSLRRPWSLRPVSSATA